MKPSASSRASQRASAAGAALASTAATPGATGTLPVWLLGAGGLMAGELLRLLATHPRLSLAAAITRQGDEELSQLHPQLARGGRAVAQAPAIEELARTLQGGTRALLVLALPHGEAASAWHQIRARLGELATQLLVLDLSADHRLARPAAYRAWYGEHPDPAQLGAFAYGLPELERAALAGATRIAAPGCFATALQLATCPAAAAGLLDAERPWIYSAVTGSSGSGSKPGASTHHPHRHGNLWAYAQGGHRHEAELARALEPLGLAPALVFTPHSGPFVRGIHLTAYLPLARAVQAEEAHGCFARAYAGAPFVEVLAQRAPDPERVPDLHSVVGSNRASLGLGVRGSVLVVACTLDNLIKGGSGQALQALNVALGWPETTGLPLCALGAL